MTPCATPVATNLLLTIATASKIILKGDGRTMPTHFDPAVLGAFRTLEARFAEIYDALHH